MRGIKLFADFETTTANTEYYKKNNDVTITLFYIKEQNKEIGTYGTNLKDFFNHLKSFDRNLFIYFHNLSFDGDFLLKYLNKTKNIYRLVNQWENKKINDFSFFRTGNKIFKIELLIKNNFGKKIYINFLCSLLILSSGIEALGKSLGMDKYKGVENVATFYDVEPKTNYLDYSPEYLNYIKNDVEIAEKSLTNFENTINNYLQNSRLKNIKRKININDYLTIGALAYELQEKYTVKTPEILKGFRISKKSHDLITPFFLGGFTTFNPNIQYRTVECPNGLSVDINSAHPHSMTQLMPFGELHEEDEPKTLPYPTLEYYVIDVKIARSKTPHINILFNWKKKYNLDENETPTINHYSGFLKNFRAYYLAEEWEYILKFYEVDYKIVKKYWCYASNWLEDFIKDLYFFKQKYTNENKKALANTFKILLNSSYGKHATRLIFDSYYICRDEKEKQELLNLKTIEIKGLEFEISEFVGKNVQLEGVPMLTISPTKVKEFNFNKIVAATVTAYTRIKLYKMILAVGFENFLYCDTDSVYIYDCDESKIKNFLDDYELGKWKIEKRFSKFITRGAKTYTVLNNKNEVVGLTFGGINKRWLKDNFNIGIFSTQEKSLELAKLQRVSCPSGIVLLPKDVNLKHRSG